MSTLPISNLKIYDIANILQSTGSTNIKGYIKENILPYNIISGSTIKLISGSDNCNNTPLYNIISNISGYYEFTGITSGSYTIRVEKENYVTKCENYTIFTSGTPPPLSNIKVTDVNLSNNVSESGLDNQFFIFNDNTPEKRLARLRNEKIILNYIIYPTTIEVFVSNLDQLNMNINDSTTITGATLDFSYLNGNYTINTITDDSIILNGSVSDLSSEPDGKLGRFSNNKGSYYPGLFRGYVHTFINEDFDIFLSKDEIVIDENTKILLIFDDSGSMGDTLEKLQDMVYTGNTTELGKSAFYNTLLNYYNSIENYNNNVIVKKVSELSGFHYDPNIGSSEVAIQQYIERTFKCISSGDTVGSIPGGIIKGYLNSELPNINDNIIIFLFQDESYPQYLKNGDTAVNGVWVKKTGSSPWNNFVSDFTYFKQFLNNLPDHYYRVCVFGVINEYQEGPAFRNMIDKIFNKNYGSNRQPGDEYNVDDYDFTFRTNVIDSEHHYYYYRLCISAFSDFGLQVKSGNLNITVRNNNTNSRIYNAQLSLYVSGNTFSGQVIDNGNTNLLGQKTFSSMLGIGEYSLVTSRPDYITDFRNITLTTNSQDITINLVPE